MAKKNMHLPKEVIMEILLRLPVKSVLSFKCVCKLWLSIISDPNFAISHFHLAASPTHKYLFIDYDKPKKALSIDFNASHYNDSAFVSLSLDFVRTKSLPEIGGSCRGFLFMQCYKDFYLWNPCTGVRKRIPVSPIIIASNSDDTFKFLYGFGYDFSTDDYILIVGSYKFKYGYNYHQVSNSIDFEIFSLKANKWKQVEVVSNIPYRKTSSSDCGPNVGLFFYGSIHWLVHNYVTKRDVILAFDLKEVTLSEIALPHDFSPTIDYDLLVFGERISLWCVKNCTCKIWVMQKYGVHSSWSKTLDFSFFSALNFSPLCFTNCGDIVGLNRHSRLVKLNDKVQLPEYHSFCDFYLERSQMTVYTESMLSLPNDTDQTGYD